MKPLAIITVVIAAILPACSSRPVKPYAFTELVLQPGMSVTAESSAGTITVAADDSLKRTYTWEGASRSVELCPRCERWYGNLGAYYPGPGNHWREHHGITRGVLQEGQQHFENVEEALAWIHKPWHEQRSVYRDDGLFILFAKIPERRQINVDVIQIMIGGRKPTTMPGSQNDKIKVTNSKRDAA